MSSYIVNDIAGRPLSKITPSYNIILLSLIKYIILTKYLLKWKYWFRTTPDYANFACLDRSYSF